MTRSSSLITRTGPTRIGRIIRCLSFWVLALALATSSANAQDKNLLVVIVGPKTPLDQVSIKELRDLYLGNVTAIQGVSLKPVNFSANSQERLTFEKLVLLMTSDQFTEHWRTKRFLNTFQKQPSVFKSAQAVRSFVSDEPGTMGYIPLSDVDPTVRAVRKVDGHDLADKAYPLRINP